MKTKDEMITDVTGLMPRDIVKDSISAVRMARSITEYFIEQREEELHLIRSNRAVLPQADVSGRSEQLFCNSCGTEKKQEMLNDLTDEEFRANANLIASAPELLEALFELVSLKKWKDEFGKDEWYLEKQPIAWKNAEKVLEKTLT